MTSFAVHRSFLLLLSGNERDHKRPESAIVAAERVSSRESDTSTVYSRAETRLLAIEFAGMRTSARSKRRISACLCSAASTRSPWNCFVIRSDSAVVAFCARFAADRANTGCGAANSRRNLRAAVARLALISVVNEPQGAAGVFTSLASCAALSSSTCLRRCRTIFTLRRASLNQCGMLCILRNRCAAPRKTMSTGSFACSWRAAATAATSRSDTARCLEAGGLPQECAALPLRTSCCVTRFCIRHLTWCPGRLRLTIRV